MKTLITAWLKAKAAEEKAREKRHVIESEIEKLIPGKEDGVTNYLCDDYKITITRKLDYKVDMDVWNGMPLGIQDDAPVRRKIEVDVKKYKQDPFPELVIVKPAKPTIKIERIE